MGGRIAHQQDQLRLVDQRNGLMQADPGALPLTLLKPFLPLVFDLQEVDAPTFRPTNLPNRLTLQPPALTLPTRQAGALALGGG